MQPIRPLSQPIAGATPSTPRPMQPAQPLARPVARPIQQPGMIKAPFQPAAPAPIGLQSSRGMPMQPATLARPMQSQQQLPSSAAPRPLSTTIAPRPMSVSAPSIAPGVSNPSAPGVIAARPTQPQPARPMMAAPSVARPMGMMSENGNVARSQVPNTISQPRPLMVPSQQQQQPGTLAPPSAMPMMQPQNQMAPPMQNNVIPGPFQSTQTAPPPPMMMMQNPAMNTAPPPPPTSMMDAHFGTPPMMETTGMQSNQPMSYPSQSMPQQAQQQININPEYQCPPRYTRLTCSKFPASAQVANQTALPIGGVIQPLKQDDEPIPVVNFGATVVRCKRCRAYINPFVI